MLKVGVIGLGAMGKNHVRVYSELDEVDLVGVADIDYSLAQRIAKTYGTKPFSDYKKIIQQELDAVSIVVPSSLHGEVAAGICFTKSGDLDKTINFLEKEAATDGKGTRRGLISVFS